VLFRIGDKGIVVAIFSTPPSKSALEVTKFLGGWLGFAALRTRSAVFNLKSASANAPGNVVESKSDPVLTKVLIGQKIESHKLKISLTPKALLVKGFRVFSLRYLMSKD
jgi:hypothetical protein